MLAKTHLFEARTEGYHTYRVPGMLCSPNGVILATAEARRGWMCRSNCRRTSWCQDRQQERSRR